MSDTPAPAGTPTGAAGETSVITTASGAKFRVAEEFVENFRGFLAGWEAAGGHIDPANSGGLSERPNNASYHPLGRAIDVNQTSRNTITRGLPGGIPKEEALAHRWGLRAGSEFSNPDRGHYEVNNGATAKAAVGTQTLPPAPTIPPPKSWTVVATNFKDNQVAYSDVKPGWNDRFGYSVPFRFPKARPLAWVKHEETLVRNIPCIDVGPWNTTDSYWTHDGRPRVESQYKNGTIADNGRVPTNNAAFDVTIPLDEKLGLDGKGIVTWGFEPYEGPVEPPKPEPPKPSPLTDAATQDTSIERAATRVLIDLATKLAKDHEKEIAAGAISIIDKLLGGRVLVGQKTALALVAYGALTIAQALGYVGTTTPTATALMAGILVLGGLGLLAKLDRLTQAISAIAREREVSR